MEELARIVAQSMARHGCEAVIDHRRLAWSPWVRCEWSDDLLLIPSAPGIVAFAEDVGTLGPSETRVLAVFEIAEAEDLGAAFVQLFAPGSRLRDRLRSGRCFARFTPVADRDQRQAASTALREWLARSAETEGTSEVAVTSAA
jgi:hypothetical protein